MSFAGKRGDFCWENYDVAKKIVSFVEKKHCFPRRKLAICHLENTKAQKGQVTRSKGLRFLRAATQSEGVF